MNKIKEDDEETDGEGRDQTSLLRITDNKENEEKEKERNANHLTVIHENDR